MASEVVADIEVRILTDTDLKRRLRAARDAYLTW